MDTASSRTRRQRVNSISFITSTVKKVDYLSEFNLCNIHNVGKSEEPFNIRLNNHIKLVKDARAIKADKHCSLPGQIERQAERVRDNTS